MPAVSFSVPFVAGKARPRFRRDRAYTTRETERYERAIWGTYAAECRAEGFPCPVTAPYGTEVEVEIKVWGPLPKSRRKGVTAEPYTVKPDADNISKLVLDALNPKPLEGRVGAWRDDAQVTHLEVRKVTRARGVEPRTDVTVKWEEA